MIRRVVLVLGVSSLLAAGLGACDSSSGQQTRGAPSPAAAASTVRASRTATSWIMPDLIGAQLQSAQDRIQALTDFAIAITTSHDATGAGRHQVLDRNWKVCSQNVPPGATIYRDTRIDFGAVKLDEHCP